MTDNQRMADFYDCKEDAFTELVKLWRPKLERYFRHLGWSAEDAEDMATETLMKVFITKSTTSRYDPVKPFPPWIYTIAYRVHVDWMRRKRRHPLPIELPPLIPDHRPAPRAEELDEDLEICLGKLDEQEQMFVILWEKGLGELSQTEIAEVLGVGDATVNRIKNRAMKKLRICMEGKGYS